MPSPTMDRLAKEGLRYNRFHTTALCSPTRAALITGRNHHSASFAGITELATGYDGYCCVLPRNCGTVGEVLRQNGYMTAWIGKNHNTPTWETSAAGPFDRWASGLGFDYFYGFMGGDMDHWNPVLYEDHNPGRPASDDPDYHLTERPGRPGHPLGAQGDEHRARQALLPLCRPRRHPRAAPRAARMDREVQGQVRPGLGRLSRTDRWSGRRSWAWCRTDTKLTARSKGLPAWDG